MDELLTQFLIEGRELVTDAQAHLHALLRDPADSARIDGAFRAFHTLKGSVALFDMAPASRVLHAGEGLLDQARAGKVPLSKESAIILIDCIDHVDRWIDALEVDGHLPSAADSLAEQLLSRLRGDNTAVASGSAEPAPPVWLDEFLAAAAAIIETTDRPLTAFRYQPDVGCFFRGDDPLRTAASVPDMLAMRVLPRSDWPDFSDLAPFDCMILIEGITTAPLNAVHDALRMVGDQVDIQPLPARRRARGAAGQSIRIDAARIDALAEDVGELARFGHELAHAADAVARIDAALGTRMHQLQAEFERGLGALHRDVTAARRVALGPILRRLPRLVRELGSELGRQVVFTIEGDMTEVDKTVGDMLYEPLLHLVRNAIDHGIEPPDRRQALGKAGSGRISLLARRLGDTVVIALSDDGAGIDPDRIRTMAIAKAILPPEAVMALADRDALQLVFSPGFSTADKVTQISGRGVGLDAVKSAVEAVGGHVAIESMQGRGTTTTLTLPLSAITTRLLLVHIGGDGYGVPFHRIIETVRVQPDRIRPIGDGLALVYRGRTIPVVGLAPLLSAVSQTEGDACLLIVEAEGEPLALAVDAFGRQIEAMIRPSGRLLAGLPAITGTAVLGDGQVLLVLDPARLVA
ncbi:chemotaxis protein CheA [Acidisoma cellulosilytica]|uniref:Chemotaxis protein CheA n=1 Tax=Acidisoma cellulosilyticum TaxID=2802395 RepID=A0A963Z6R7_9PROT|nr:chemotaxis protein CheA [Acidisoma cellulosilyticum]MCB8883663.1 chemotaxis protein CheA [Acidisoma cellulosilyticum]